MPESQISRRRSIGGTLRSSFISLLVGTVAVFTAIAYRGVKTNRMEATGDRLASVSRELAGLTAQSVQTRIESAQAAAADPRIRDYLARDRPAAQPVRDMLDSISGRVAGSSAELWSPHGQQLLVGDGTMALAGETRAPIDSDSAYVGPIRVLDDSIFSETVAPVLGADGTVIAHFVHRRRGASATQVRDLLSDLIGDDALFLVGNVGGNDWTDLVGSVGGPDPAIPYDGAAHVYERAGAGRRLGAAAPIAGSPWIILVEFPMDRVLAPARKFLTTISLTALGLIAFGVSMVWVLSRRITRPLRSVTAAANAMAGGDYTIRLSARGDDEVSSLASAFNVMAERVDGAHNRLEAEVASRTDELNTALAELRDAQSELVRREKLAMLGQLSSGLGHELRNPLGVMSNAVYFLEAISTKEDERVAEYLGIVREQIALSEKIVGDLLDFARIKEPDAAPIPLRQVIDDQIARVGVNPAIQVRIAVPEDLRAWGDPVQLGQVFFNLFTNAAQAMGDGRGTLEVAAEDDRERVTVTVRDNGCGIPADCVDKIFEPLFTTKARGIGLGLAVTRAFVNANGGGITVQSHAETGTVFTVTLRTAAVMAAL